MQVNATATEQFVPHGIKKKNRCEIQHAAVRVLLPRDERSSSVRKRTVLKIKFKSVILSSPEKKKIQETSSLSSL